MSKNQIKYPIYLRTISNPENIPIIARNCKILNNDYKNIEHKESIQPKSKYEVKEYIFSKKNNKSIIFSGNLTKEDNYCIIQYNIQDNCYDLYPIENFITLKPKTEISKEVQEKLIDLKIKKEENAKKFDKLFYNKIDEKKVKKVKKNKGDEEDLKPSDIFNYYKEKKQKEIKLDEEGFENEENPYYE